MIEGKRRCSFWTASLLVSNVASQIINSWPNKKLLNYSCLEQIKDILPYMELAVSMGVCVYLVTFLNLGNVSTLAIQVVFGAVIYILGSKLFKFDSFEYILNIVKSVFSKGKNNYYKSRYYER